MGRGGRRARGEAVRLDAASAKTRATRSWLRDRGRKVEGRYLDNADGVAQVEGYEDTLPGDPWTQNVRVPEEEALDTEAAG